MVRTVPQRATQGSASHRGGSLAHGKDRIREQGENVENDITQSIQGLPEGIEAVRWGEASQGEYLLTGAHFLEGAPQVVAAQDTQSPGLVVKAAPGYEFVLEASLGTYFPVRAFPPEKITFEVTVVNTCESANVQRWIANACKQLNLPLTVRRTK